jgi:DNA-binding transcriptional LysR family regulator
VLRFTLETDQHMIRNLDTNLLRAFVAVASSGGMTSAGSVLHLTQGAVSQQIKRLEDLLGCRLFERDRRGLRLTPHGERLFGKTTRLLHLNDEIWSEMTERAIEGEVRLGVPYDLAGGLLIPVIKAYGDTFPQVEISVVCATSPKLAEAMAAGKIDLALIQEPGGSTTGECLKIERLVWVGAKGGNAYLKRPLPISMVADTCAFRLAILTALREHGIKWRTVFENDNINVTTATVRADIAITAWLASTVPPDLDILPVDSGLPELPNFAINLYVAQKGTSTATAEFARRIRNSLLQSR